MYTDRRSTADGHDASGGRRAIPSLIKDSSALDQLTMQLQRWTPGSRSDAAPARHDVQQQQPQQLFESESRVIGPAAGDAIWSAPQCDTDGDALASGHGTTESDSTAPSRVSWSAWDQLKDVSGGTSRRVLLAAYDDNNHATSSFTVWDCSNLDSWCEILSIASLESVLSADVKSRVARRTAFGHIVGAAVLPVPTLLDAADVWQTARPLIAVLTRADSARQSHVLVYSLRQHEIIHVTPLQGLAHQLKVSSRNIVLSTTYPSALHVLSASTFSPIPFSPISDLELASVNDLPVFDLGRGGRVLAYATTRPVVAASGPARFDSTPANAGAGVLAHAGMFGGDEGNDTSESGQPETFSYGLDARTAGHVGGEVAKRVGQGVWSGAKAIGGLGMSYYRSTQHSAPSNNVDRHSHSAPLPSAPDFDRRISAERNTARRNSAIAGCENSNTAGTVIVVDLAPRVSTRKPDGPQARKAAPARPRTLAHFRPYRRPLAAVSLSPSSTSVFTSPCHGHAFDVFELRPATAVGSSSTDQRSSTSGKVWHRYRLQRGLTSADTVSVTWSDDSRLVGVGTSKGTMHIYALLPYGGVPTLMHHFDPKTVNALELPPLSVSLSTVARLRPTFEKLEQRRARLATVAPALTFVTKANSTSSSLRPPATTLPKSRDSHRSAKSSSGPAPSRPHQGFQDCLVFYPAASAVIMQRLTAGPPPSSVAESAIAAASRGDVGKMASSAVSGLTQLMKAHGALPSSSTSAASDAKTKSDWIVSSAAKAVWDVSRPRDAEDVKAHLEAAEQGLGSEADRIDSRYSAQAEIETFSRSPRVMPRSIYGSQQFEFFALPSDHAALASIGDYSGSASRRIETRSTVQVRQGVPGLRATALSARASSSPGSLDSSFPLSDLHPFDQPIKSAMQTVLDQHDSPSSTPPPPAGFPNGVPGKSGSSTRWHHAIAIPIRASDVNAGLTAGFNGARVLGKVGSRVAVAGAAAAANVANRRRASRAPASSSPLSLPDHDRELSSSVSFEEDAVFADHGDAEMDLEAGQGSYSTAGTSHSGRGQGVSKDEEEEQDEDEAWGLDGLAVDEQNEEKPGAAQGGPDVEGLPFDDFDDLEMDLAPDRTPIRVSSGSERVLESASTPPMLRLRSSTASPPMTTPVIDFDTPHEPGVGKAVEVTASFQHQLEVKAASAPVPAIPLKLTTQLAEPSPLSPTLLSSSPASVGSTTSILSSSSSSSSKKKTTKKRAGNKA